MKQAIATYGCEPKELPAIPGNNTYLLIYSSQEDLIKDMNKYPHKFSLLILGDQIKSFFTIAQSVHARNQSMPILILCQKGNGDETRKQFLLTPMIGANVKILEIEEKEKVEKMIEDLLQKRKLQMRYDNFVKEMPLKVEVDHFSKPDPKRYLEQIVNHAPIGIMNLDGRLRIQAANPFSLRLLELENENLIGQSFLKLFSDSSQDKVQHFLNEALHSKDKEMKDIIDYKDNPIKLVASNMLSLSGQKCIILILQEANNHTSN